MNAPRTGGRGLPTWALALALASVAALALIATGCGPRLGGNRDLATASPDAPRVGPPESSESLDEAADRLEQALGESGCTGLDGFVVSSRPQSATPERCQFLKQLAGLKLVDSEEYGDGAAVIDFKTDDAYAVVAMLRDRDGRYKILYADLSEPEPVAGSDEMTGADETAELAYQALAERDCPSWNAVLSNRTGPGTDEPEIACQKLHAKSNDPALAAEHDPDVELEALGGDQKYAFYGLSTTKGYFVLIVVNDYTDPDDPVGSANPALLDVVTIGEVQRGTT